MTRTSVVHHLTEKSQDSAGKAQQLSEVSSDTTARTDETLVALNLRSLPIWIPISEYLLRTDDPFPYGKYHATLSQRGG
ncbi:hypothetical protein GGR58DRAFT_198349 [Xylaria digitata]|nr:hypothetical protein GGR58DRAFT_198349 [Xylaria digitata]